MGDDTERDPGEVFAIPDLYAPSRWLSDEHQPAGLLFSRLTLDGMDLDLCCVL